MANQLDDRHDEGSLSSRFQDVARELSNYFPTLDLRFNLRSDNDTIRCLVAEDAEEVFEMSLADQDPRHLVYEAVFAIKEAFGLLDD